MRIRKLQSDNWVVCSGSCKRLYRFWRFYFRGVLTRPAASCGLSVCINSNAIIVALQDRPAAVATDSEDDMVVIYNRVPKTGSTSFVGIAYQLYAKNNYHVLHFNISRNKHVLSVVDQVYFKLVHLHTSHPSSTSTFLRELSNLHRIISYMSRSPARLSVVKPLDMLLLQFGIPSHSTSDILLLVPLNVI